MLQKSKIVNNFAATCDVNNLFVASSNHCVLDIAGQHEMCC